MDSKFQALAELFVELLVVILLLGNFCKHLEALLHKILLDDTQNLVLLQRLSRDVQRKILRIHDAFHKIQPLWDQLVTIIHDENAAHIQLDVVAFLLCLKQIEGSTTGHEQQRTELQLTLNAEMLHGQMVFPIVRQRFVERCVLLVRHILRLPHPEGFVLVELLPLVGHLLHLLRFFFLLLFFFLLVNFLDFGLITLLTFLLFLFLFVFLRIGHFLFLRFLHIQLDREADEFRMFLHQILQATFLQEFGLVLLQVTNDLRAPLDLSVHHFGVFLHGERTTSRRLPDVLFIVVVLANHTDLVRNQIGRIEANSKLPDHGNVAASTHGLHESLGTRLGDSAEIVHELVLCHANTRVLDRNCRIGLVRDDFDEEIRLGFDFLWICDGLVANLVKGIGRIRNQLTEKDFFVGVECVDDQAHQLLNVGIEGESLRHGSNI
mmetsp:Transcript_65899/g.174744  ORF Transcript_65899/g.174744 Transcript_65899/m.174744 type:complete len:435 (-) Transcript_65899:40-1344(-)